MKIYTLERQQWIPQPLPEVFDFFSRVENLDRITPPWLRFRILTPLPAQVEAGSRLDYSLRLAGVPVKWRTRITVWEPGKRFVDFQERGPYALWEHSHRFLPVGDGVLMADTVRYALPLGPLGELAHGLRVRSMLGQVFDYRFDQIRRRFGSVWQERGVKAERTADGLPQAGSVVI